MTTSILIAFLSLPDAFPERGEERKAAGFAESVDMPISWWQEHGYEECAAPTAPSLESRLTARALLRGAIGRGIPLQGIIDGDSPAGWPKKVS